MVIKTKTEVKQAVGKRDEKGYIYPLAFIICLYPVESQGSRWSLHSSVFNYEGCCSKLSIFIPV